MMSVASVEELPLAMYTQIVATIQGEGKKAEAADSWALAAIYRPKSKIPVHIWKAAPSTSMEMSKLIETLIKKEPSLTLWQVFFLGKELIFGNWKALECF
ncbi:hypothetical protein M422DRAFT_251616 [Sphaerobolus stellatus SS14]|uniref:Uncharacterized protein n=1 Tax=Sphaerobolus stellatus (strain SS14) TaxID=990650 RepID=A0A0C9W0M5_SPHS4|nr:hypothetical protein M422DRAFT_251616 [Sphaerobolus stellatus SS14]